MMQMTPEKIPTGIKGLDELLMGGTVAGSSIMVEGRPGTGKTTVAMQFILSGTERGEPGAYITMEESPAKIKRDALSFGWDLATLEEENRIRIIATSPEVLVEQITQAGPVIDEIRAIGATRVAIDSITLLRAVVPNPMEFRIALATLLRGLEREDLRTLLIRDVEPEGADPEAGFWARYSVDVLVRLDTERVHSRLSRRVMEVIKSRGQDHVSGLHAYKIDSNGVNAFPRIVMPAAEEINYPAPRVVSGVAGLDDMLRGGFIYRQPILATGPTGSGKTLLAVSFVAEGARQGEPSLLVTTEESVAESIAHAKAVGIDITQLISSGTLDIEYVVPTEVSVDEYLYRLRKRLDYKPYKRLAIDSLNTIEIMSPDPVFVEDVMVYLSRLLRSYETTAMMTYEMRSIVGDVQVSAIRASISSDTILILRLVEIEGSVAKSIAVLKHRGSAHATDVRQLMVDENGLKILSGFKGYQGVLTGVPAVVRASEDQYREQEHKA